MTSIEFPQENLTMRAGRNTNTVGLRVSLCSYHHVPGHKFYLSKWEMEDFEKQAYRNRLVEVFNQSAFGRTAFTPEAEKARDVLIDEIMKMMPKIFLSCMDTHSPVMLLAASPIDEPYPFHPEMFTPLTAEAGELNKINGHPDEN